MKNSRVKILAPLGRYFTGNKINQTIVNSCIKHLPAVSDDLVSTNWAQLRQAPCSPGRAGLPDLPNEGARCAPQAPLHKGTEHIMVTGGTLRYISLLCRRTCITAWALPFYFHHIVVVFFPLFPNIGEVHRCRAPPSFCTSHSSLLAPHLQCPRVWQQHSPYKPSVSSNNWSYSEQTQTALPIPSVTRELLLFFPHLVMQTRHPGFIMWLLWAKSSSECRFRHSPASSTCGSHPPWPTPGVGVKLGNTQCTISIDCCELWKCFYHALSQGNVAVFLLTVGRSATHTVVFAQLYVRGKCYGVHPFIVQIRSLQDHSLCPGKHCHTL